MKIKKIYIVLAIIGALLTPIAVHSAFQSRSYFAFGSEWLVLPLLLLIKMFVEDFIKSFKYVREEFKNDAQE